MNISTVDDNKTAHTSKDIAKQRAENLYSYNIRSVIELCAGPSLKDLEEANSKFNIKTTGNDIDERWKRFYPKGKWIIQDALKIDYQPFDAAVFAPPLSKGCTGKRSDSLEIESVTPSYYSFINEVLKQNYGGLSVLVLPARSLSTKKDRSQLYKLLSYVSDSGLSFDLVEMTSKKRNIRKYIDLYLIQL